MAEVVKWPPPMCAAVVTCPAQAARLMYVLEPDADEQGRVRDVFVRHFAPLSALFKHYSGYGSGGSVGAMSFTTAFVMCFAPTEASFVASYS